MIKSIQAIRGMNDYLPGEITTWQRVENILKKILESYGYNEIRLPIVEKTQLFKRIIGEVTDVVEKEMYTFVDRNGDSLTLRPEGTAGCVRASIEHNLLYNNQKQRLWYIGPMFRHERPQKGRYRQFYQLGVEAFGMQGPNIDAELIMITARWWRMLGVSKYVSLELNSIGSLETRSNYCNMLIAFLEQYKEKLDDSCKKRMYINPLRILDSKDPQVQMLLDKAPMLYDYLDSESREHFTELCKLLEIVGISYKINQRLVRGLDYYNRTVFEWTVSSNSNLDLHGTICAGGRYDGLTKQVGNCGAIPAVGFAIGLERLVLLVKAVNSETEDKSVIDIYLITSSIKAQYIAICLAERIRDALPDIRLIINYDNINFKKQFVHANRYRAYIALVLGESEVTAGKIVIKNLLTGTQIKINQDRLIEYLHSFLLKKNIL